MAMQLRDSNQQIADNSADSGQTGAVQTDAGSNTSGDQAATGQGRVVSKLLNIRNGPSTANDKVGQLNQGDVVNLLKSLPGWWQIGDGQYVSADYIQAISGDPATDAGVQTGQVISGSLNVRSAPAITADKIAELQQGAQVSIYESSPDGWYRIGDNQWVLGKFVQRLTSDV
jgi:uncharacterized protein YgiM (DUF1202 family)